MKKVAECLYLNESSGTYFALVKRGGKQIRRSLKTQDRKLAERRLKEFRIQAGNLSKDPSDRRLKFGPLADRWFTAATVGNKPSTEKRTGDCVRNLKQAFGESSVASINRIQCENWAAMRSKEISARTFNYDLLTLKRIFKYAIETGIILSNPAETIKKLKESPKKMIIPTREEFAALIETLEARARRDARTRHAVELVKLLAYSGMRLNEGASLRWGDVNLDADTFTVTGGEKGTKNGEIRHVPIFGNLLTLLEELWKKRTREQGHPPKASDEVVKTKTARTALESACREAELPRFGHHDLRHYFASNSIESGVDFKTIAAWFGHKDGGLLISNVYGHLRKSHSHEMAKLVS